MISCVSCFVAQVISIFKVPHQKISTFPLLHYREGESCCQDGFSEQAPAFSLISSARAARSLLSAHTTAEVPELKNKSFEIRASVIHFLSPFPYSSVSETALIGVILLTRTEAGLWMEIVKSTQPFPSSSFHLLQIQASLSPFLFRYQRLFLIKRLLWFFTPVFTFWTAEWGMVIFTGEIRACP